jgi:hypothetical protein
MRLLRGLESPCSRLGSGFQRGAMRLAPREHMFAGLSPVKKPTVLPRWVFDFLNLNWLAPAGD